MIAFLPTTTDPAYVPAKVKNEGPKVKEVGASVEDATEYTTYAEEEAS